MLSMTFGVCFIIGEISKFCLLFLIMTRLLKFLDSILKNSGIKMHSPYTLLIPLNVVRHQVLRFLSFSDCRCFSY